MNAVYPAGHHGNAILSRFPIDSRLKVDISTNVIEQRGFLYCRITPVTGITLHCFCIHLGLLERSRRKQLERISSFIGQHVPQDAPLIIAGDFNDWQGTETDLFERRLLLINPMRTSDGKNAPTFPAGFPLLSLDRIYLRGLSVGKATICCKRPWSRLSDHAGILCTAGVGNDE